MMRTGGIDPALLLLVLNVPNIRLDHPGFSGRCGSSISCGGIFPAPLDASRSRESSGSAPPQEPELEEAHPEPSERPWRPLQPGMWI